MQLSGSSGRPLHSSRSSSTKPHALQHHARIQSRLSSVRVCAQQQPGQQGGRVDKGLSVLEWTGKLVPQGQLVYGVKTGWRLAWQAMVKELAPQDKSGAYQRPGYAFANKIGETPGFPVASGRYHMYVGNACPWCHRVLLVAVLRGLLRPATSAQGPSAGSASGRAAAPGKAGAGGHISFTRLGADPTRARRGGWVFEASDPDPVWGAADLWQVYDTISPGFRGRCTAPLVVDRVSRQAVSNESSDICRMLNAMHLPGCTPADLYPAHLRQQIDALNDEIYTHVNNGVYRSGFATTQAAYDEVQRGLYRTLDALESRLSDSRFLLGDKLTEADVRLLPTVVRFDAAYATLFKCTRKRIADYPNLSAWMRDMWQIQVEGSSLQVKDTVDIDAARTSYFSSLFPLNPSGIVPAGPTAADLRLEVPHGRGPSSRLEDVCHLRA